MVAFDENLERNLELFLRQHSQSLAILKRANGSNSYLTISKDLKIHPTTVSSVLKFAEQIKIAKKINGNYKKVTGSLGLFKRLPKKKFLEKKQLEVSKSFKSKIRRTSNQLEIDAWKNAEVYPLIYILENRMRELILTQLGETRSWWKKPFITRGIMDYAERIKQEEGDTPWIKSKGDNPIYYVTLSHLCKIIRMNWSKFNKFGKLETFFARFDDLFPIRNNLAHNVPLTNRDKKEITLISDKILILIKSKYGI